MELKNASIVREFVEEICNDCKFCISLNFKRNLEIRLISVVKKYIYIYSFYFNPRCSFCGTNTSKDFECEPQIYNILDVIKN